MEIYTQTVEGNLQILPEQINIIFQQRNVIYFFVINFYIFILYCSADTYHAKSYEYHIELLQNGLCSRIILM